MAVNASELRTALVAVTRDRLGRFVHWEKLSTCADRHCSHARTPAAAIEQHDAFLETIEQLVATTDPAEIAELAYVVREYRLQLREDAGIIEAEADTPPRRAPKAHWVKGYGVPEHMDVTGLTGREASTLALKLNNWNPHLRGHRWYVKRQGRRFMTPGSVWVDLNHDVMLPYRDELLAAMRDPATRGEFEGEVDPDATAGEDAADIAAAYDATDPLPTLTPIGSA